MPTYYRKRGERTRWTVAFRGADGETHTLVGDDDQERVVDDEEFRQLWFACQPYARA